MGASLAGVPFSLDPTSLTWDFSIHSTDAAFLGGKVIQVFGATIGDITVEGHFRGKEGHDAQMAFLERMKALADKKVDNPQAAPIRFLWPEQGWDFQVYLRQYSTPDGTRSIRVDPMNFAPRWRLILFPVRGTEKLKQASVTTFIDRLAQGMGWKPTRYNGPLTFTELQAAMANMGATDLTDFYAKAFGLGGNPTATPISPTAAAPGTTPSNRVLSADEVIRVAAGVGLTGQDLRIMVAVAKGESSWNPSNVFIGPRDHSIGLWQINQLAHKGRFGTDEELKIPERNAQAMKSLLGSQGKKAWSVYTSGKYLQYMPEVNAAAARMGL